MSRTTRGRKKECAIHEVGTRFVAELSLRSGGIFFDILS